MSAQRDPDFDQLGAEQGWDAELYEMADYLRASPHPYAQVEPAPQYRMALRRRLMREAWDQAAQPPQPWYRRLLAPQPMAWAGAAVGAVLIFTVAFLYTLGPHQTDHVNVAVTSPQQNAVLTSTAQPITLTFSQPMDTSSVKVDIRPATQARQAWQGNTLTITPVNGLSGNTQYQVSVTTARTKQGQSVAKIQPVVFSTGPTPTPTPSSGPTPTPTVAPIQGLHPIGPIGSLPALWTPDGGSLVVIAPGGQLQLYPAAGGQAQKLADGATTAAVAPDGSVAWFNAAQGTITWKTSTLSGVQPVALGFRQSGTLLLATASDVETAADRGRLATLSETADAADFSPGGDRLAYHGPSGIHLVDLSSGKDTVLGPGSLLGDWSPDDRHYAYPTDAGVAVADAVGGGSSNLVSQTGVAGVSWSRGNQLLLATASSLFMVNYTDGSAATPKKLSSAQDAGYGQPDWSPNGSGEFSFKRAGEVWVGTVRGAVAGGPVATAAPALSQDDLVTSFMTARQNQLANQALQFLDTAGQNAFAGLNLVYSDPSFSMARYYVLLSQPGRVVVRLVLSHAGTQTALDETLVIQPDASGRPLIHGVTETPRTRFAAGPEVLHVTVSGGQVQVTFDSDLDPSTASQPGAVGIKGVTTQSTFDSKRRTVTLTVPGGLTPGTSYDLIIAPTLQDLNQRTAVPYDLTFNGPAASTASVPSPSPS